LSVFGEEQAVGGEIIVVVVAIATNAMASIEKDW